MPDTTRTFKIQDTLRMNKIEGKKTHTEKNKRKRLKGSRIKRCDTKAQEMQNRLNV